MKPQLRVTNKTKQHRNRPGFVCLLSLLISLASFGADTEPSVSVSVNDSGDAQIFPGMPLLVSITVMSPTAFGSDPTPTVLAATVGPWTNSIRLDVLDASEKPQAWPFNSSIAADATITLDNTHYAQLDRWLTPQQTLNLSKGSYSLAVTLDTIGVTLPGAWIGTTESTPASLEILAEPLVLTEAQAENKFSQLAFYELFLQNGQAALNWISQLLAAFPENFAGLRIKVLALYALGRTIEAQDICEQAIQKIYAKARVLHEPPENFLLLRRQLRQSLLRPALRISRTGKQEIALDWSGHPSLNYLLESSTDLFAWSFFKTNFNFMDQRYSLTVPALESRRFFRLSPLINGPAALPR
ncbi:MAG: hypothetical protein ABI651_16435 [Verrucomicrobiota bacterium]